MTASYIHPNAAPFRFEASGEHVAVLLHGWTGSPAHLRPLGRHLAEHGITAYGPLLAGHGTAVSDMQATTWRDWLRSAAAAVEDAAAIGSVHLFGLSMGGLLSLLMAPTFGVATVATLNTPVKLYDRKVKYSSLLQGTGRTRAREADDPVEPEMVEFYQHYEQAPIGRAADLYDLIRAARTHLYRVRCPLLVIQSRADATVRPESARIIHDGVASVHKRLVWLHSARHVALVDPERSVVHSEVVRHVLGEC